MRNLSPRWLAILLSLFMLSACSQKEDAAPLPGAISGQITPANAMTAVVATDGANHSTSAVPNSSGAYQIDQLSAGVYTLAFTAAAGYTVPPTQKLTVAAGQTTTAAPITSSVVPGMIIGTLQYPSNAAYAGGVTAITATDAANHTTVVVPTTSGQYTFNDLPPVSYTLTFTTNSDFAPVSPQTVTVRSFGVVSAAPAVLTLLTTGTFTIDGTSAPTNTSVGGTFPYNYPTANSLSMILAGTGVFGGTNSSGFQQVGLYLGGFTGTTGTYSFASNGTIHADLSFYPSGTAMQGWVVDHGRGGSIILTAVKDNPRRASGSFSFVATAATASAAGTKTVAGSFSNMRY